MRISDWSSDVCSSDLRRTGSLRRVRVIRGNRAISVDLYGLLGIGLPKSVRLQDGDRITVPVIGDTVAVTGGGARPGIYELPGRAQVGPVPIGSASCRA